MEWRISPNKDGIFCASSAAAFASTGLLECGEPGIDFPNHFGKLMIRLFGVSYMPQFGIQR